MSYPTTPKRQEEHDPGQVVAMQQSPEFSKGLITQVIDNNLA